MIDQSIIAGSEFSTEQYQDMLANCWEQLFTIKLMLDSEEQEQTMTTMSIANAKTCTREITGLLSLLPEHFILTYIVSREALVIYLQKASLELGLVYDQLTAKRKTRRYYRALLLCQEYINKALEQKSRPDQIRQGLSWNLLSSIQRQNNLYKQFSDVSIHQGRQYQMELPTILDTLDSLHQFFQEGPEIWPDQCTRAFALLQNIQAFTQEMCGFLDALACSQAAISSCYCRAVVIFHNIDEQISNIAAQVDRYRAICRSSSLRSINTKQLIFEALASALQSTDEGVRSFTRLLDLTSFQERRAREEDALSHFA